MANYTLTNSNPVQSTEGSFAGNNQIGSPETDIPALPKKVEEKQAWKVLSDPHAEERHWIAACKVVRGTRGERRRERKRRGLSDASHAWLAGLLGTFGAIACFFFGFSILQSMSSALGISDQLTTFSPIFTGVLAFIGLPSAGCALVGLMQRGNRPEVKYTWLLPWVVPLLSLACALNFRQEYFQIAIAAIGIITSRHAYKLGLFLSKSWRQLGSQSKLLAPYLWSTNAFGIWLVLDMVRIWNMPSSPHEQSSAAVGWGITSALAAISYATGIATALGCRSRRLGTQVGAVLTIQTPTVIILTACLIAGMLNGFTVATTGVVDFNMALVAFCSLPIMVLPSLSGALTAHVVRAIRSERTK